MLQMFCNVGLSHLTKEARGSAFIPFSLPLPLGARTRMAFAVVDDYLYFGMGHDGTTYRNDFYRVNLKSGSVETLADAPEAFPQSFLLPMNNGYLLLINTYEANKPIYAYDPDTDSWSAVTSFSDLGLSTPDMYATSFVTDGDTIWFGGTPYGHSFFALTYPGLTLSTLASVPDSAVYRDASPAFYYNGKIYLGFGAAFDSNQVWRGFYTRWWEYDIATDTWTEKNRDVFGAVSRGAGFRELRPIGVWNGLLFAGAAEAAMAEGAMFDCGDRMFVYSPTKDKWSVFRIPIPFVACSEFRIAVIWKDYLLMAGGKTDVTSIQSARCLFFIPLEPYRPLLEDFS